MHFFESGCRKQETLSLFFRHAGMYPFQRMANTLKCIRMEKILAACVQRTEDIEKYKALGCDEPVIALKGYSFTALPSFAPEQISGCRGISLLMNRLFFEEETEDLKNMLKRIEDIDPVSIYFADPAVLYYASDTLREKLIYRPDTLMTSTNDAQWWLACGIRGISVSPLLTKEEVLKIASSVPHTEITVHGRLLMSVSRRKLLDVYASDFSKEFRTDENRNLMIRESKRKELMPVYQNEWGTMIYTDFVQESFEAMPDFMKCAERFYIDTVFMDEKAAEETVRAYRAVIDGQDSGTVGERYSREFGYLNLSTGYYGQKTIQ